MEADLQRFYNVDLRDRIPLPGHRRLTLRRIAVLLRYIPGDASTALVTRDRRPHWSLEHLLLADIWQAVSQSKKPHPALRTEMRKAKQAKRPDPDRVRKIAQAKQRVAARKAAIAAGEIT